MSVEDPPLIAEGDPVPDPRKSDSSATMRGVASATGLVSLMVLLSRGLGFVRDAIIAALFGQGPVTDAYRYGFKIPDVLWMLVAGGVMYAAYVPVITEYMTRDEDEEAWNTFSIIFTFLFCLLTVVIPLCWIFARPLLDHFLAPEFAEVAVAVSPDGTRRVVPQMDLAVHLTRILLPAQYFFFLGSLMMGMLQSKKRFLAPALGPVIYNLGIIFGGLALHRQLGITAFAWGALVGAFVGNLLIQMAAIRKIGARFRPSLHLRHPGVKRCGRLALPVIFGISLPQVDSTINGMVISSVKGGVSILENTNRLMQLPLGIVGQALGIAILPTLSQQAAQNDTERFKEMVNFGVRMALYLTVPLSVLLIVLARPIIAVVFQRGEFTALDTRHAVPALICYALGIGAYSAQAIVARAFYARQDTRTPVLGGMFVAFVIFVPLNYGLFHLFYRPDQPWLATQGPALATSIGATINFLLLFVLLQRKLGGMNATRILKSLARITVGCLGMAAVAGGISWWVVNGLQPGRHGALMEVLAGGGAGLAVFGLLTYALGSEEARQVGEMVRGRLMRRRRSG
ncbi:MAG: murein biosynthesis integral membrane protein MurJ [Armatimonadetes bacterium]|nr:murein biosynthesis integral membrane protein MurJ [Armatimonadota bacterium]